MQHAVPRAPTTDIRWLTLFCLARAGFSFIFTIYSAALPLLRIDWQMSAARAGMVQSAWHVGYMISLFGVGFLCDRFGAKRTYMWSAVAASIAALVFALFSSGFWSGLMLYGLAGLCSGGSYTPGLTIIAERFPPSTRGRAMGFYLAASSLGYALSIMLASRLFPLGGWRLAILVTCTMPAVGLAISLLALRNTPNIVHAGARNKAMRTAIPAVLRNRPALLSMLAYTFHCWELLGMWAWLPAFLAAAAQSAPGQNAPETAIELGVLLSGLTYFTSMLGSLIGGDLSDRWGRTRTLLLFSCISIGFSFTFGWMAGWPLSVLFMIAACYNLSSIADSSIYSTALTELVEPPLIGAAYAVRSVMGFGAGAISPWVFGLVLDLVRATPNSSETLAWGLAWVSLGLGALLAPIMNWRLRGRPEAFRMARGLR
ncbi:MAG: MFS transporter [Syntrophobacter sp.]